MNKYRHDLVEKAKKNRREMNKVEAKLWYQILSSKKLKGYKFVKQKPIGRYIVDFYCHKLQLVIEVDGRSHDDQIQYDNIRTEYLESLGLSVIRFSNLDVMQNLDGVYEALLSYINDVENVRGE